MDFLNPDFETQKQVGYERRLVRKFLESCGVSGYRLTQLIRSAGEDLGLSWFNSNFLHCPVAVESRKITRPVQLGNLLRREPMKEEFWKWYQEALDNWGDERGVALVFDHHGDGVGDLVMHDRSFLLLETAPYVRFYAGKNDAPYFIQELKWFLQVLGSRFKADE